MFREMKHKNQQLSQEEAVVILQRGKSGVFALHGDNGYPLPYPSATMFTTQAKSSRTAPPKAINTPPANPACSGYIGKHFDYVKVMILEIDRLTAKESIELATAKPAQP